jgi:hypothetical protein
LEKTAAALYDAGEETETHPSQARCSSTPARPAAPTEHCSLLSEARTRTPGQDRDLGEAVAPRSLHTPLHTLNTTHATFTCGDAIRHTQHTPVHTHLYMHNTMQHMTVHTQHTAHLCTCNTPVHTQYNATHNCAYTQYTMQHTCAHTAHNTCNTQHTCAHNMHATCADSTQSTPLYMCSTAIQQTCTCNIPLHINTGVVYLCTCNMPAHTQHKSTYTVTSWSQTPHTTHSSPYIYQCSQTHTHSMYTHKYNLKILTTTYPTRVTAHTTEAQPTLYTCAVQHISMGTHVHLPPHAHPVPTVQGPKHTQHNLTHSTVCTVDMHPVHSHPRVRTHGSPAHTHTLTLPPYPGAPENEAFPSCQSIPVAASPTGFLLLVAREDAVRP